MHVYIRALNKTVSKGFSPNNIKKVLDELWNKDFEGITGKIVIDERGERITEFLLHDMNPDNNTFEPVIYSLIRNNKNISLEYNSSRRPIYWLKRQVGNLSDTPRCGYNGAKCPVKG
jgi:hypothetical protein